jgi:hypothetical protein
VELGSGARRCARRPSLQRHALPRVSRAWQRRTDASARQGSGLFFHEGTLCYSRRKALAFSRQKTAPLRVEVPGPGDERLRYGRVGIIALVGFVIGMAWPRLAGVKLVPSAPSPDDPLVAEQPVASASAPAIAGSAPAPAEEPAPPAVKPVAVEPSSKPEPSERLRISEPQITSCHDEAGKRVRDCDHPALDRIARPRILSLAECPAAGQARGTLSLGLELDFGSKKVKQAFKGKSTTLDDDKADALVECAKSGFASAALDGIEHQSARYTAFYRVEFLEHAIAVPTPDAGLETTLASGRATVVWEVAILRSSPTKDGDIVARIMRGTRLAVTGRQTDWYKVKYDAKGSEGWVYRTAIGL